jgi:calcineurin-like phosphoesterase family protein
MTIFFTSDNHFNHDGIIPRQPRPFRDLNDMNAGMIRLWNETVGPDDTVYVLGDFAYDRDYGWSVEDIFHSLNGHKHLIQGNHDEHEQHAKVLDLPWESQQSLTSIRVNGTWFTLCHYAMETWRGSSGGTIMLHGHSHGSMNRTIPHRFDVGVDVWDYRPVPAEVFIDLAAGQTFEPQDMHGRPGYHGESYE